MIPELGRYAIILAFCLAIIQATLPLVGAHKGKIAYMQLSRYTAIGQFFFVAISFSALAYAFLTNDFSVVYVAQNSNSQLPLLYKFCAIWGAHEGSLLLWIFVLSIWMAAVSLFSRSLPIEMLARVLAVLAMVAIGFYLFLLLTSDPFQRYLPNFPVNGRDLNPILQDPGLAIHPPMLYMGYVGFSVAFAFAIAALISGRLDAVWARWSRPWTIVAWCFLTFGIVLGSWWAYRELGWGGFWFWDPVENASFMPWLAGTALIHSLAVTEKRQVFKAWTVLLAVSTFALSLLGTFLVRSGILISVHAFAVDPKRGLFMLEFLAVVVGASFFLYALRARRIVVAGHFHFWSRESMLIANNVCLFVAMMTVLLGTLYPLMMDALGLQKISVGAPYFNTVFIPLMMPLLFLMGLGPQFRWQFTGFSFLIKRIGYILFITIVASIVLISAFHIQLGVMAMVMFVLAIWVFFNTLSQTISFKSRIKLKRLTRSQWAMVFAHIGMVVTVIGLVFVTSDSAKRNLAMKAGDSTTVGPYQFQFKGVSELSGPNYSGAIASFLVSKNHERITVLHPEQRDFTVGQTVVAKSAIDAGLFRDIYVALGSPLGHGAWAVRIYYEPFVRWIWLGGLLMVLGGALALWDKRYRFKMRRK